MQRIHMSEEGPEQTTVLALLNAQYAASKALLPWDAMRKGLLPNGDPLTTYIAKENKEIIGVVRIVQPLGQPNRPIELVMFAAKTDTARIPLLLDFIRNIQAQYQGWAIEVCLDDLTMLERMVLHGLAGAKAIERIQILPQPPNFC